MGCPLPMDPAASTDTVIHIPRRRYSQTERDYLKTAIEYTSGMRDWWLAKETVRMRKELDED